MSGYCDYLGREIPTGRPLTTYEPQVSGNLATGTGGDNWPGYLISNGSSKTSIIGHDATGDVRKRLIILCGAQDAQEQTAHYVLQRITEFLVNPKTADDRILATKLLRAFDFLVVPFVSFANVRDGRSRYSFDAAPPGWTNTDAGGYIGNPDQNGISWIGYEVVKQAMDAWVSDHPVPSNSVFSIATWHCDCFNILATSTEINAGAQDVSAPYARIDYPGYDSTTSVGYFRHPASVDPTDDRPGFDDVIWPEFWKPSAVNMHPESLAPRGLPMVPLSGYGGKGMYFEIPWAHATHKASHYIETDDIDDFARAYLAGISTVGQVIEAYEGPAAPVAGAAEVASATGWKHVSASAASITGSAALTVAVGRKGARGNAAAVTGTAAVTAPGTRRTSAGTVATVSGAAAVTSAPGRKRATGSVASVSGTASVSAATGTQFVARAGTAASVTSTSLIASATGRKAGRGSVASVTGNSAVALAYGFAMTERTALAVAGIASVAAARGSKWAIGVASSISASSFVGLARGYQGNVAPPSGIAFVLTVPLVAKRGAPMVAHRDGHLTAYRTFTLAARR